MKTALTALIVLTCLFITGCAALDKIAPAQYDEAGNVIPASREPTEITKAVAGAVPYGDVALNILLLAVAGVETFKRKRTEKGLKATLLAGKQVANDPKLKEMWEKAKESYYRDAHDRAGVTSLIKLMLAKL